MEIQNIPLQSIFDIEKFNISNIKNIEEEFHKTPSITFIQKIIDDQVKFDKEAMIYMMQSCSNRRLRKNIITLVPENKEYYIIGDIHADGVTFQQILKKTFFYDNYENKKLLFLGDYIDRGMNRFNVINILINLEFFLPENIIVLKGNHELFVRDENGLIQSPMKGREKDSYFFTFLNKLAIHPQYKEIITIKFIESYASYFEALPIIALLDFQNLKIMCVHGGLPRADLSTKDYYGKFDNLEDFFQEDKKDFTGGILANNFLWADPYDGNEMGFRNTSHARYKFDINQFIAFCKKFNIDLILRAHEAQDYGYKKYFNNRLISVFSTGGKDINGNENKSSAYHNVTPNILKINLENNTLESYEILFSNDSMICEESFDFDNIKIAKIEQEKNYKTYEPNNLPITQNFKTLLNSKILKISDKFNLYTVKQIDLINQESIKFSYWSNNLNDFYGIDKDFNVTIDCINNTITNNCDIDLYIDRFILRNGESLPFSEGEYILQSGGILNISLI